MLLKDSILRLSIKSLKPFPFCDHPDRQKFEINGERVYNRL